MLFSDTTNLQNGQVQGKFSILERWMIPTLSYCTNTLLFVLVHTNYEGTHKYLAKSDSRISMWMQSTVISHNKRKNGKKFYKMGVQKSFAFGKLYNNVIVIHQIKNPPKREHVNPSTGVSWRFMKILKLNLVCERKRKRNIIQQIDQQLDPSTFHFSWNLSRLFSVKFKKTRELTRAQIIFWIGTTLTYEIQL